MLDLFKRILVKEITWLYFSKPARETVFYTKNALLKMTTWVLLSKDVILINRSDCICEGHNREEYVPERKVAPEPQASVRD